MAKVTFITRNAGFDISSLGALYKASQKIGIEAWAASGMFYRPFLNGRFGPPQLSTDKDVCVRSAEEATALTEELRRIAPHMRWAVAWHPESAPIVPEEQPLTIRCGAVRQIDAEGRVEVMIYGKSLEHLHSGLIGINGLALEASSSEDVFWGQATGRARKLLREYPGMRLSGRLKAAYKKRYGKLPETVPFIGYTPALHQAVVEVEGGATKQVTPVKWGGLHNKEELDAAWDIVQFYRHADRRPQPVPVPAQAKLPAPLQALADRKQALELNHPIPYIGVKFERPVVAAPEGFETWLHYVCYQVDDDATFREWLLNQIRSGNPHGGKDAYLAAMLDNSLYQGHPAVKYDGEQKVTHGGWQLDQHLIASALQLVTDALVTELRTRGWTQEQVQQVRAGMRLGMLHHDIGKLVSINKPGAHGGASVALWNDTAPEWVDEPTKQIAAFCMMGHDYFGRVARAITEKVEVALDDAGFDPNAPTSYQGAMCPQKIADIIARYGTPDWRVDVRILRLIWEADAGSVQTLRWVLPVANPIERILIKRLAVKTAG